MTRKEEAADCRRKARSIGRGIASGLVDIRMEAGWWAILASYDRLAEALEMECQVRDVVVGDRRAA